MSPGSGRRRTGVSRSARSCSFFLPLPLPPGRQKRMSAVIEAPAGIYFFPLSLFFSFSSLYLPSDETVFRFVYRWIDRLSNRPQSVALPPSVISPSKTKKTQNGAIGTRSTWEFEAKICNLRDVGGLTQSMRADDR